MEERATKKIAQLTKVIVGLNAQCEDAEGQRRALIEQHEAEVQVCC